MRRARVAAAVAALALGAACSSEKVTASECGATMVWRDVPRQ